MPFLIPVVIAGLGGLFVGSQVDNAVQAKASAPAVIDQSKMPWYVQLGIAVLFVAMAWPILRKLGR